MTEPARSRGGRPLLGAALVCALLAAGCAATGEASPAEERLDPTSTSTSTSAHRVSTTSAPPIAVDAGAALAAALAGYDGGYEFQTSVTLNGAEAATVTGRQVGADAHMRIGSGDAEVEYLAAAGQQFARSTGGEWSLVSESVSPPPLATLAEPAAVRVVSSESRRIILRGTYDGATLGTSGPLEVLLIVDDGTLTEARYVVEEGDVAAVVVTAFSPLTDSSPITAPG